MFKIGPKALEARKFLTREEIPEALADDPIYTRGFAIGEMRSTGSQRLQRGKPCRNRKADL